MIQLRDVTKIYRTQTVETRALSHVNLDIEQSDFIAITGPSGCGKSTLLNVVGMIDSPTSGEYTFLGDHVGRLSERELASMRNRHIGFIFQGFNLVEDLTVFENVELPLRYLGMPRGRRRFRVREVLEAVDLVSREMHKPAHLSGGQQQRVAVARAVVGDPALIVADEPTGNLDSKNGEEIMSLLEALHSAGTTVLMVTHSAAHASRARKVYAMTDGEFAPASGSVLRNIQVSRRS
ncbi:MAG TPA: ABC transporter ATP-binding protein [Steroidobacteraceae bacterium]|jgi:putative ABC transport system ATP-binding protein|nr:ABC transporter ATP-binding protein [Steroidobacteraceae bacterium]